MINIIETGADNVVGFQIDGKVEEPDYTQLTDLMEDRLKKHPKLRMYAELVRLGGVEPSIILKDIRFGLRHLHDFDKAAVVSDQKWVETLVKIESRIFPSPEARHFHFQQKEEALAWVKQ